MSHVSFTFGEFCLGEGSILELHRENESSLHAQFIGTRGNNGLLFYVFSPDQAGNPLVEIDEQSLNYERQHGNVTVEYPKPPFERDNPFAHDYYHATVNPDGTAVQLPSLDESELPALD